MHSKVIQVLAASMTVVAIPGIGLGAPLEFESRDAFFAKHSIPEIEIHLDADAVASLGNRMREYVKATVKEGTNFFPDVGVHLKGQYGTFQGLSGKPSLTLNFDKYVKGQRFHGLDKLHLNNSVQDPSYLCEYIGRQVFNESGVPTGRASHARVQLNGRNLGFYVLIEGYDRTFLKQHFQETDGNLYDSEFRHEVTDPLKRSGGTGTVDHSALLALAEAAEHPVHSERIERLAKILDLDRYYKMLALEMLLRHHDGYSLGINNYRVYQPATTGKAVFLPGGMDQLFYEPNASVLPDLRGLISKRILETQDGRSEFRKRCRELSDRVFPELSNRVALARDQLRPVLTKIGPEELQHGEEAAASLLSRIEERQRHLAAELASVACAPSFDRLGVAGVTNWTASFSEGRAGMYPTNNPDGFALVTGLDPSGGHVLARWQAVVMLAPGSYRISANVTADEPVFRGPTPLIRLSVWGEPELQLETERPTQTQMNLRCGFVVAQSGEYVLQLEAKGIDLAVSYRFDAVKLARTIQ